VRWPQSALYDPWPGMKWMSFGVITFRKVIINATAFLV
jgi:hypothetical protein